MSEGSDSSAPSSLADKLRTALRDRRMGRDSSSSSSCMVWLLPLLIIVALAVLLHWWWRSCRRQEYADNNNNDNNNNGVVISRMTNPNRKSRIIDATGADIMKASADKDIVCIFMSSGCGHCKHFKPVLDAAIGNCSEDVYVLMADKPDAGPVIQKHGVRGFPTAARVKKGQVLHEFSKQRTPENFAAWVNNKQ